METGFRSAMLLAMKRIYERYTTILRSSIRRHLISDVPVGFYLSSGIDSSSVVYYSTKIPEKNLKTYTGFFGMSGIL